MSGFMISPIGIVVIAGYSFVILMPVWFLSRLMSKFRWKWVLLVPPAALLLSLPWVEEAWISWHFKEACKDAGVKVYRQVEVEGYMNATTQYTRESIELGPQFNENPTQQADFEEQGYRYLEQLLSDGGARHLERLGDKVMVTIRDKPEARYYYRQAYQPTPYKIEEPIGWKLEKIERQAIDSQTGEILGRETVVVRVLPTHEALIAGLFGPPIVLCPSPNVQPYVPPPPFPQAVLKPLSK